MRWNKLALLAATAGAAIGTTALAQPASFVDLGDVGPGTNTISPTFNLTGGLVQWYRINLLDSAGLANYLDISTFSGAAVPVNTDTMIGLYNAAGARIATDDDDGVTQYSSLTFGSACFATRPNVQPPLTDGAAHNGRDGATLAAGEYFLAVSGFSTTFPATLTPPFTITSTHTRTGEVYVDVNMQTGTVAAPAITASTATSPVAPGANMTITATSACATAVSIDLSPFGGSATQMMFDDGTNGDVTAGNGVWTYVLPVPAFAPPGLYTANITASNGVGSAVRSQSAVVSGTGAVTNVKISKVDGNGGINANCPTFDLVEIYNPDASAVNLSGYSVQVATATGTTWANGVLPAGFMLPGQTSALIRVGTVSATGIAPNAAPDYVFPTTSTNLSTSGKVALVNSTTTLTAANPTAPAGAVFIDKVGYGSTATAGFAETANAPILTTAPAVSLVRRCAGSVDTNNNSADFLLVGYTADLPRNIASGPGVAGPSVSGVTVSTAMGFSPFGSSVQATAAACTGTITGVTIDLSSVGGSAMHAMLDDGIVDDGIAGNGIYGTGPITIMGAAGNYNAQIRATDSNMLVGTGNAAFNIAAIPTTVFDFGDMSVPNCQMQTFDTAAGETKWFLVSLSTAADAGLGTFLDIDTELSAGCPDTEIGLYRADGTLVASDDDDGSGGIGVSQLSFGAGTRPASAVCGTGGIAYNGRDGNLPAGTYYIAAGRFNMTFNPTFFSITNTGPAATGMVLTVCSQPPTTPPSGIGSQAAPINELEAAVLRVTVTPGMAPTSSGIMVVADASSLGGSSSLTLLDDGVAPDATAGDNIFTASTMTTVAAGSYPVPFTVSDAEMRSTNGSFNAIVTAFIGGCCATDGSCTLAGPIACQGSGGTYQGAGTNCGGDTYAFNLGGGSAFEDISGTGTVISATPGDDASFNVPLSFPFTFYGTVYNDVNVCTNGFLQFAGTSTTFTNVPIPAAAAPNNMVAVLWDDFNFTVNTTDNLQHETRGTAGMDLRQIFQWTNVAQFGATADTDFNTFQCVLFEDGRIEFRYASIAADFSVINADTGGATVGVEDSTGSALSAQYGTGASPVSSHTNVAVAAAAVPNPCIPPDPCDPADFNGDGDLNPDDLSDFITCFFTEAVFPGACPEADFNGDGGVDPDDLSDYITLFFGCV